jgi:hypothetical protein
MIAAILSTISGTNEPERLFGWLNVVSGFIAGSRTLRIIESGVIL